MNSYNLKKMYDMQQYHEIIHLFNTVQEEKTDELKLYAGFVYTKMGMATKAIECLTSINRKQFHLYIGKIYRYLGVSNYLLSDYNTAQSSFDLGAKNNDKESALWNRLLFPHLYDIRETENIIFRFVDEISAFDKKIFIFKNIKAFKRISEFIGEFNCYKKIDIYVYTKRQDSIGNSLSYSDNGLKVIHTYLHDVKGHEIAHILFNSIYRNMTRNRFIDEGIATFFDDENTFIDFIMKHKSDLSDLDVIQVWNEPDLVLEDAKGLYYYAGAFVGFLIKTYGKHKFIEFIQNENYENARLLFGDSLDFTIQKFYNEIK